MYYHYPLYYFPVYLQNDRWIYDPQFSLTRPYPPIDTKTFSQSAKTFKTILKQGELLIDRFGDVSFSYKVMDAAQKGEQTEVNRLVQSIEGLSLPVKVRYTPSGVQIDITAPQEGEEKNCCTLTITLKWGS